MSEFVDGGWWMVDGMFNNSESTQMKWWKISKKYGQLSTVHCPL
jgi:hypothetical protein